jgi:hypothetical protein
LRGEGAMAVTGAFYSLAVVTKRGLAGVGFLEGQWGKSAPRFGDSPGDLVLVTLPAAATGW